jgi:hypothetical protein
VQWINGQTAPPELSSLAIFDFHCARSYLDSEGDFSYAPYGIHIFEGLAKVCTNLKVRIETEKAQWAPDLTAFNALKGDTPVGKLIETLSATTTKSQIDELASLTLQELTKQTALEKSLKEDNPKEKATQLPMA